MKVFLINLEGSQPKSWSASSIYVLCETPIPKQGIVYCMPIRWMESKSWRNIKTRLSYAYGLQAAVLSDKWSNSPEEGGCWEWIWKKSIYRNFEVQKLDDQITCRTWEKDISTTLKTGEILCLMMLTWDIAGVLRVIHWILNVKHKQVLPISLMVSGFVVHCVYHEWLSKATSYCQQII